MKHILITAALALGINSQAYSEDLDELLKKIESDISAQRLAKPVGNNALERIHAFRAEAPFDFRITPLIFKLGESYVALANKAMDKQQYQQAQEYLDIAWKESALTPGLESAQARNDKLSNGKNNEIVIAKGPSAAEQKALALAASEEKKRLDAANQEKINASKAAKKAADKKAAADKKIKEENERKRRLANQAQQKEAKKAQAEQNAKASMAKKLAEAKAEKERLEALAAKKAAKKSALAQKKSVPVKKTTPVKKAVPAKAVVKTAPVIIPTSNADEESPIRGLETSASIASYPLSQAKITDRNRSIKQDLVPMCQAIIDNDASIVLHTKTKSDYRWLTVRLTLCIRRLDPGFRLRHSFDVNSSSEPFMTLHPSRSAALVGEL
jgi:colicin import membrane protein